MSSFTSFRSVLYSRSCKLMWMSLRACLLYLFNSVFFSITNLQNLGHQEPGILPFLCTRQLFLAVIFSTSFEFFNHITMVKESRLLEWYVMLENQSFIDQLCQSVSISKFLFYLIEFFKFYLSECGA